jgi:hypothetical protein
MITAQLERVEKLNICMQLAKYKKIHLQYFWSFHITLS